MKPVKFIFFFFCLEAMISCGTGKRPIPVEQDTLLKDSSNLKKEGMQSTPNYRIEFNNQGKYESYGSILGQPTDTLWFADTVRFFFNEKPFFTETGSDYIFYKNNPHWPKNIVTPNQQTVFFLERSLGEPEGADIIGFIFEKDRLVKRVEMSTYPFWKINMSKNYEPEELQQIVGTNPL